MSRPRKVFLVLLITISLCSFVIFTFAGSIANSSYLLGREKPSIISVIFSLFGAEVPARLRYDINDCKNAKGYVYWSDSREAGTSSNKYDCYSERAKKIGDWETCQEWDSPANCLITISNSHGKYVCDKALKYVDEMECNEYILKYRLGSDALEGLEKYRKEHKTQAEAGQRFEGHYIYINPDKSITIDDYPRILDCKEQNLEPITMSTKYKLKECLDSYCGNWDGETNYFITGCSINTLQPNLIQITYYTYDLNGIQYPYLP